MLHLAQAYIFHFHHPSQHIYIYARVTPFSQNNNAFRRLLGFPATHIDCQSVSKRLLPLNGSMLTHTHCYYSLFTLWWRHVNPECLINAVLVFCVVLTLLVLFLPILYMVFLKIPPQFVFTAMPRTVWSLTSPRETIGRKDNGETSGNRNVTPFQSVSSFGWGVLFSVSLFVFFRVLLVN